MTEIPIILRNLGQEIKRAVGAEERKQTALWSFLVQFPLPDVKNKEVHVGEHAEKREPLSIIEV